MAERGQRVIALETQHNQSGRPSYPLAALVGQEQMRLALALNAISPEIGGVLLGGEKGSAKSTAARALAALLPQVETVEGCPLRCAPDAPFHGCPHCGKQAGLLTPIDLPTPLVELPLGATEDRVLGSIEIERTIRTGERHFEPGLLATAHRGILYIDEVNLLPDHLVDLLLDVAAMGVNTVEREGFSYSHPSRFLLIGTMNPEEGELRPQFLDRFGLSVAVSAISDAEQRAEVVRRRIAYEADPPGFCAAWEASEQAERERIRQARAQLGAVAVADRLILLISHLCSAAGVEGLRADLVIYRAARALAAYAGRTDVGEEDVRAAAALALPHRQRRRPFEQQGLADDELEQLLDEAQSRLPTPPQPPAQPPEPEPAPPDPAEQAGNEGADADQQGQQEQQGPQEQQEQQGPQEQQEQQARQAREEVFEIGRPMALRAPALRRRAKRVGRGRRKGGRAGAGSATGAAAAGKQAAGFAFDATLRAAAPYQLERGQQPGQGPAIQLRGDDLRVRARRGAPSRLILFVVDASGSMGAQRRMAAVKGAIVSLLQDAYSHRDEVALISFRGETAEVILPPTRSVDQAQRLLATLPSGGRTPLAHGLQMALRLIDQAQRRGAEHEPLLVLLSDGRANVPLGDGQPLEEAAACAQMLAAQAIQALVVDSETGYPRFGLARGLSEALAAEYVQLEQLEGEELYSTVRRALEAGVEARG